MVIGPRFVLVGPKTGGVRLLPDHRPGRSPPRVIPPLGTPATPRLATTVVTASNLLTRSTSHAKGGAPMDIGVTLSASGTVPDDKVEELRAETSALLKKFEDAGATGAVSFSPAAAEAAAKGEGE